MQDSRSCISSVRALVTWSGALTGLFLMLIGGFTPSALFNPGSYISSGIIDLPSTWQVPAVLVCPLTFGPNAGVIASIAYITIGLIKLPIFHGGGGLEYLLTPGFGFIASFIPAAWVTGRLSQQKGTKNFLTLSLCGIIGILVTHLCGVAYLTIGSLIRLWPEGFLELLVNYSVAPLPTHLILCQGAVIIALITRKLLFIE